jgi:hypothetical protein
MPAWPSMLTRASRLGSLSPLDGCREPLDALNGRIYQNNNNASDDRD